MCTCTCGKHAVKHARAGFALANVAASANWSSSHARGGARRRLHVLARALRLSWAVRAALRRGHCSHGAVLTLNNPK